MIAFLVGWAAAQTACPSRVDALDRLEEAVLTADYAAAEAQLEAVITTFACGPVASAEQLARLWNLEGALLVFTGETDAAVESFQASRRMSDAFPEVLGSKLEAVWSGAPAADGDGEVSVDPKPVWWTVAVDGAPGPAPRQVPVGLHLVQIGPSTSDIRLAKVVYVGSGATALVANELVEGPPPAPVAAPAAARPADRPPVVSTHTAIGVSAAIGAAERDEPAAKVHLPLEVGASLRLGRAGALWIRPHVAAGPTVTGPFVYAGPLGDAISRRALAAALTVGGGTHQGDFGACVGLLWPGRISTRVVASLPLGDSPWRVEPRLGLNAGWNAGIDEGRGAEPAVELLFTHRLPF